MNFFFIFLFLNAFQLAAGVEIGAFLIFTRHTTSFFIKVPCSYSAPLHNTFMCIGSNRSEVTQVMSHISCALCIFLDILYNILTQEYVLRLFVPIAVGYMSHI